MRLIFAFIVSILFYLPANSATYYVSDCQSGADANCVNGNDSNNGTSTATPWRTFAKAVTGIDSQPAGTTILFANGGVFSSSATTTIFNQNVSAGSPLTISNYQPPWGSGDESKPRINCSAGGFNFEDSATPDIDGGYVVSNLYLHGNGAAGDGIREYNTANDVTISGNTIDGFGIGVYMGSVGASERWTVQNNTIINSVSMGYLGGGTNLLIDGNHFENNGTEATFDHNIYLSSGDYVTISDNTLYKSAFISGTCQGVSLVVHGVVDHLIIDGNTIYEDIGAASATCYGIGVDTGYGSAEGFSGAIIRNNKITNVGYIGIGANSIPNGLIENNVIVNNQADYHMGIAVPDRDDKSPGDLADTNITIRNNSIYDGSASLGLVGITMSTEGTSHVVSNNLISYAGTGYVACFDTTGLTGSSFESMDYNICYAPNSAEDWEINIGSLAAWRTARSLDTHSFSTDPLFSSLSTLELASNSPAIGAGIASFASTLDISGATRPNPPSIGAWEFLTEPSAGSFILHIFSGHGAVFH